MPISRFNSDSLQNQFNWRWSYSSIRYLGVNIPAKMEDAFNLNYPPLVQKVLKDLKRMSLLPFSLIGRSNIIKTTVLPKFLYLFQNLPITPPTQFFQKMQSAFISFIWNNKAARISIKVLYLPYNKGGLNLPNLKLYYLAAQLGQIHLWFLPSSCSWVKIEMFDSLPYNLKYLPYFDIGVAKKITQNPVILNSISIWKMAHKLLGYNELISPFTPIWRNPCLSSCFNDDTFKSWDEAGMHEIRHLFNCSTFMSFPQIQNIYNIPSTHTYRFFQVRHMIKSIQHSLNEPQPSKLDNLLNITDGINKCISKVYRIMIESSSTNIDNIKQKWENDIGENITTTDWSHICLRIHNSFNFRHRLSQLKTVHRVYLTPEKMHKINGEISFLCWRCTRLKGTFLHIFWSCSLLLSFWSAVVDIISLCVKAPIPCSPKLCLLGTFHSDPWNKYQKIYIDRALMAARKCIAIHWKCINPPTISQWLNELSSYIPFEKIYYKNRRKEDEFLQIWQPHIDYMASRQTLIVPFI